MLGYTEYYHRFTRNYKRITSSLEKLLKDSKAFGWKLECDQDFDALKEKLSTTPILVYPKWQVEFQVHIDASGISLGAILLQPSEGNLYYPIYFARRKLSQVNHNYTNT
jgi:hypothetical protein